MKVLKEGRDFDLNRLFYKYFNGKRPGWRWLTDDIIIAF